MGAADIRSSGEHPSRHIILKRYTQNGILHILDRNRRIKPKPERFQASSDRFDVIVTCEERVYDQVIEDLETREKEDNAPVHVINIDIEDNQEEATIGAFIICDLITILLESDDMDNDIDEVLQEFESRAGRDCTVLPPLTSIITWAGSLVSNLPSFPVSVFANLSLARTEGPYTQNGILHILDRNRRIKPKPERFQASSDRFDVIVTCEERVYDQVIEDLETREKEDNAPVHVINIDIEDNQEEATIGAFIICDLITILLESDDMDNDIDEVLQEFESRAGRAIQSLDSLNDQIVQYIFSSNNGDLDMERDLSVKEKDTIKSSMVLIRRLLFDAQTKFRTMVEDNKTLAARIDGSILAANQEVMALRAELADTNKRLIEIDTSVSSKRDVSTQADAEYNGRQKIDEENELIQLRTENSRLEVQVRSLSREVEELSRSKSENSDHICYGEMKLDLIQHKQEIGRAKEALQAMKADRKRLKAEKLELLNQLKQLYGTLEDKEGELRDFIKKYEQRMRENDKSIKQLAIEKDESEREKWDIIKRARDSAEISVILRAELDSKDQQIKKLENVAADLQDQLSAQSTKHSYSLDFGDNLDSLDSTAPISEDLPPYETPPPSASFNIKDSGCTVAVPTSTPKDGRDRSDSLTPLMEMFDISQSNSILGHSPTDSKKKKRISLVALSRVFTRSRSRRSLAIPTGHEVEEYPSQKPRMTLLNPDNYQEKLQLLDQSKESHMSTWKANQVLAWLEIVLSMPSYGKMCAENIKSGKVLLGLSDSELSSALGLTNPIHRRKLRLAIEEQRNPDDVKHPKCSNVGHTWVAHSWIPDLGLSQYTAEFESHLVDGRILGFLSKRDLEKHFLIHRKFHQTSILHGIELLRRLGFDTEVLAERRTKSEESDGDLLVWTNERVIKWVKSVDLEEYADNLRESGVHGALMVLEPSFTPDTLATALGIPPSKCYIRRHLATEMDTLVKTARASLDLGNGGIRSQSHHLNRSYRLKTDHETGSKSRLSFRGSLGRAFGRKIRDDLKLAFDVEMPKKKQISSPIPILPLQPSSSTHVIQSTEKTI